MITFTYGNFYTDSIFIYLAKYHLEIFESAGLRYACDLIRLTNPGAARRIIDPLMSHEIWYTCTKIEPANLFIDTEVDDQTS